jgi:hypothetical protein
MALASVGLNIRFWVLQKPCAGERIESVARVFSSPVDPIGHSRQTPQELWEGATELAQAEVRYLNGVWTTDETLNRLARSAVSTPGTTCFAASTATAFGRTD